MRDAYTKLSAGHVSIDLVEMNEVIVIPEPGAVDEYTRGKISRVAYWYRRLLDARRRVVAAAEKIPSGEFDPDSEHPRIVAAVKEIESWTAQREKVLVFGVFLRPLKLLRDVLNVRHALRAADAGRPIAHALHTDRKLLAIAARQVLRLREEGALSGCLQNERRAEVRRALQDSHKEYERLRPLVREWVRKPIMAWRADPLLLGGTPVDAELDAARHDHLAAFVLDDFLTGLTKAKQPKRARMEELAREYLDQSIRPLIGEHEEDEAKNRC